MNGIVMGLGYGGDIGMSPQVMINHAKVDADLARANATSNALELWAEWMGRDTSKLGYPGKSTMLCSGAGADFDDMAEACDSYLVQCVDTAVDNLPTPQRMAIHHRYLSAVFTFRRLVYAELLSCAHDAIERSLRVKGAIG